MVKTNLTDEEKKQIIEAINQSTEPSPDLMLKLFPRLAEKFDVAKLDRAKVATIEYAGKRSEASILNQTLLIDGGSPLQVERCFVGGTLADQTQLDLFEQSQKADSDWQNMIVQGDNLQFLITCYQNTDPLIKDKVKGKVKLIYIDPPFATKSEFSGTGNEKSYSDKVHSAEFIECLRERLIYMRELLSEDGSIYVHLDQKMSHYVKIIMDEKFGKENFRNEIIWHYGQRTMHNPRKWNAKHENILFYSKSNKTRINMITIPWTKEEISSTRARKIQKDEKGEYIWDNRSVSKGFPPRKQYIEDIIKKGKAIDDVWEIPMILSTSKERVDYPTQKPEAVIKRIISASSNEGDLIMDAFAGSGSTAAVAEKLGRRWIVCDFGKHAIYTMEKRMLGIAESRALGKDVKKDQKYGKPPKPFFVISCGAYDFSRIMNLRENKDAYINFVLGLFQLNRDQKGLNGKYKLTNIYGEKEGDPVEVYPVWEDEYLKEVRIDENYLKETITQSGGKLKGNYYIITPETCTVISDTTMKNNAGDEVHFKLLKFPYKILEDVARNFQIHDQPSSQENVNELINSTGFYFNNDVELELEKTNDGVRITRFKTRILDQKGNYYEDFDGLAMLLIDIDYNGELFDIEKTVFSKEIDENGEVKVSGLTNSIAVIAIDKHGNESNPFIIQD